MIFDILSASRFAAPTGIAMFFTSLLFTGVLLVVTNLVAFLSRSLWATFFVALVGLVAGNVIAIFISLPAFNWSGCLMIAAAAICALAGARPLPFLLSSTASALVVHGLIAWNTLYTMHEVDRRYPVVSLDSRLAYEENRRATVLATAPPRPSSRIVVSLEDQGYGADQNQWQRSWLLKRLHEDAVHTFVNSRGFGVARGTPSLEPVLLPDIESVPQPGTELDSSPVPRESRADAGKVDPFSDPTERLHRFHMKSLLDFLAGPDFGYVKERRLVAGFQEHHFRTLPAYEDLRSLNPWQVERIELVSLLKHSQPCVYRSDNLPRMDELRTAKTRPLDDFEAARLPELLKGEDLVHADSETTIRVLGAIRAPNQCLDCHNVQRGDLLGVFSYRLGRSAK
jgi:hypothetical protein